eukprot:5191913-Pleurochrysis_carterae.AAC.1
MSTGLSKRITNPRYRCADLRPALRATWQNVRHRHPCARLHLPDEGHGRPRKLRTCVYMAQNADEGSRTRHRRGGRSSSPTPTAMGLFRTPQQVSECIMYGGVAVSYGSKCQHCISLCSTEAEIVAASHTAAEVIYLSKRIARRNGTRGNAHYAHLRQQLGRCRAVQEVALLYASARDTSIGAT